jgi:hypothetical protein
VTTRPRRFPFPFLACATFSRWAYALALLLSPGLLGLTFCCACCASGEGGFTVDSAASAFDADGASSVAPSDEASVPSSSATQDDDADASDPASATEEDAGATASDAGTPAPPPPPPGPPFDAGEGGICDDAVAAGSLAIVELMIESTSGTGDHGEWVEITSTRDCALNLNGLTGNCPTGAKVNTFAVTSDAWIPARGTFVVADSSNPIVDHALPGLVIPWSGEPGDVLRNAGATVTLTMGGAIVDSVTYPSEKLTPGVSIAFPSDCAPGFRSQWTAWEPSSGSWFPAFFGTPNAANDDVHCPVQPPVQGDD